MSQWKPVGRTSDWSSVQKLLAVWDTGRVRNIFSYVLCNFGEAVKMLLLLWTIWLLSLDPLLFWSPVVDTLAEVNFFLHLYEISKLNTMHLAVWVCFGWDLRNWDPVYSLWVLKMPLLCSMLFASYLVPSTLWDGFIWAVLSVHSCKMFWDPSEQYSTWDCLVHAFIVPVAVVFHTICYHCLLHLWWLLR